MIMVTQPHLPKQYPDQRAQSAVATLLNADNGTLYWLIGLSSIPNVDLLDVSSKASAAICAVFAAVLCCCPGCLRRCITR